VHVVYLISVLLHILAAASWVGAMVFLMVVVVPMLRRDRASGAAFLNASGPRLRNLGWVAFVVLLITGTFNLAHRGVGWSDFTNVAFLGSTFGHAVVMKLTLFVVVLGLSAYHDFYLGPRASAAMARAAQGEPVSPEETEKMRRKASLIGRANALLALAIVALAVVIVRGWI